MESITPRWLDWAREIQALSQTGQHYAQSEFDRQRYHRLEEIAAEIVQEHAGLPVEQLLGAFDGQQGYATPKIDVRAAIFREGKLLMVREIADGGWTLPGGWVDVGDLPSLAAEREAWEEAGVHVKARKVVGVYDANRTGPLGLFHAFKLLFWCEFSEPPTEESREYVNVETSEVRYFGSDEIPAQLSGERIKSRQIRDAFAVLAHPDCPTVFD